MWATAKQYSLKQISLKQNVHSLFHRDGISVTWHPHLHNILELKLLCCFFGTVQFSHWCFQRHNSIWFPSLHPIKKNHPPSVLIKSPKLTAPFNSVAINLALLMFLCSPLTISVSLTSWFKDIYKILTENI